MINQQGTKQVGDLQLRVGTTGLVGNTSRLVDLMTSGLSHVTLVHRNGRHYATDAGLCSRQAALAATIEELQVDTPAQAFYYDQGESLEDTVVRGWANSRVLFARQVALPDVGLDLGGRCDAIVLVDDRLVLVEVKSCGKLPTRPKPNHHSQATIYAALFGLPASVFYVSRHIAKFNGDLLVQDFPLGSSEAEQRQVMQRAAYGHLAKLESLEPPRPDHLRKASDCGFCPFVGHCWHGEPGPAVNKLVNQPWRPVTPADNLRLVEQSTALVEELLSPAERRGRRLSLLRWLAKRGTVDAQLYLRGRDLDALADSWQ